MVVIDGHVHLLPEPVIAGLDAVRAREPWFATCHPAGAAVATPATLVAELDRSGIDLAVCFTWPFADPALCREANDWLAAVVRRNPDRLVGFGVVNPEAPGAAPEVLRCARLGLRGIGELNADAQGWRLEGGPGVDSVARASIEAGLPWNLHCSEPVGHQYPGKGTATPGRVAALADRHPDLQLICAHLGGGLPFYAHMPEVRELCRRLWFDTAAVPLLYEPGAYRAVIDACGADRVIFGSDHPLLGTGRYRAGLTAAGMSAEEKDRVMGGSVAALLGL